MGGQRTLAFAGEQAFAGEFFLQCLEGQAQGAVAGRLDGIGDQLVVAASLEQRDLSAHLYRQPVAQGLAYAQGVLPEQRAADLRVAVLEGEADMSGGRPGEVGQLALDPDLREHVFQQQAGALVQLADGQHLAIEAEPLEGIVTHGRHDKAAHRDAINPGFVRQILQEIFDEAFHQGLSSRRQANATSLYASASARGRKRTAGGAMARIEAGTRATPKPASISCNWLVLRDSARGRG